MRTPEASETASTFRAFIALALPDAAREALVELQERLRHRSSRFDLSPRWTQPDHLHLTVKFLGRVARESEGLLKGIVARRAAEHEPIATRLGSLAGFASLARARVLVVRLEDPDRALATIAAGLQADAETLSVPAEARTFAPHVTLARFGRPADTIRLCEGLSVEQAVRLEELRLYESRPTRAGSRYTVLARALLGQG